MDIYMKELVDFVKWFALGAPRRIFITLQRILRHTNNEVAFTLNLKLYFQPLFGDYTKVGRIIGVVFRTIWLFVGSIAVILVSLITFIAPLIWYLVPLVLLYWLKLWFIPLAVLVFVARDYFSFNIPNVRVYQVDASDPLDAFRPDVRHQLGNLEKLRGEAIIPFLKEPEVQNVLNRTELLRQEFLDKLVLAFSSLQKVELSAAAYQFAKNQGTRFVEMEHLFVAAVSLIPNVDTLLSTYGSSFKALEDTVDWIISAREELAKLYVWQEDYVMPTMGGVNRGLTGRVTKYLDAYSRDYTEMAKWGKFKKLVGREKEIEEIAKILSSTNSNILIIGEAGSGKTAIVQSIANKVMHGTQFESLKFKRIVALDSGLLIAGAATSGDLAGRISEVMQDVEGSGGIVLFIDEIHTLLAGSGQGSAEMSSAFSVLEPYLASGKNQFIAATSIESYRKYIEPNSAFSRLFEIVEISEASEEDTLEILKVRSREMEKLYGVTITYPALQRVIKLSKKLIHERVFPDKALDVLNRAAVSRGKVKGHLTSEDVAEEISKITHVPVSAVREEETERLLNIEDKMREMVIGQDQALVQIGRALKRARVGIRNEDKPIASFLFVGTTGVGKTQTAKAVAKSYFGTNKNMIRLDMSEYQQPDSINRLLGSSDGNSKGQLTQAVRNSPFALLLLDEIEKAYSNILLTFLQVLDDGRLTDSSGRLVDFTNTIIIATSNTGTRSIQEVAARGGTFDEMHEAAMKDVREKFAPEFLNRFTGIIVFRPLTVPVVRKIAGLLLESVRDLADQKKITVTFKPELIEELVRRGYNPQWGARPLARVIEDTVETYLATKILQKEIGMGDNVSLGLEVFEAEY